MSLDEEIAIDFKDSQQLNLRFPDEILNEFVDIVGKHVEQQLGKTIETSNPIGLTKKEWDALSQEEKNKINEC